MNYVNNNVYTGDSRNGNLSKEQFATIVDGALVYDEGKDDYYVFGGMKRSTAEVWVLFVCMFS